MNDTSGLEDAQHAQAPKQEEARNGESSSSSSEDDSPQWEISTIRLAVQHTKQEPKLYGDEQKLTGDSQMPYSHEKSTRNNQRPCNDQEGLCEIQHMAIEGADHQMLLPHLSTGEVLHPVNSSEVAQHKQHMNTSEVAQHKQHMNTSEVAQHKQHMNNSEMAQHKQHMNTSEVAQHKQHMNNSEMAQHKQHMNNSEVAQHKQHMNNSEVAQHKQHMNNSEVAQHKQHMNNSEMAQHKQHMNNSEVAQHKQHMNDSEVAQHKQHMNTSEVAQHKQHMNTSEVAQHKQHMNNSEVAQHKQHMNESQMPYNHEPRTLAHRNGNQYKLNGKQELYRPTHHISMPHRELGNGHQHDEKEENDKQELYIVTDNKRPNVGNGIRYHEKQGVHIPKNSHKSYNGSQNQANSHPCVDPKMVSDLILADARLESRLVAPNARLESRLVAPDQPLEARLAAPECLPRVKRHQYQLLENSFKQCRNPHYIDIMLVAAQCDLSEQTVTTWFEHRLALWRKQQGLPANSAHIRQ